MKKEVIIHIGTHKTGSSSIQESFYGSMGEGGVEYFDFGEPNHSHVMASLFLNNPYNYHFHRKLGKTKKYVDAYVSEWFSVIDRQIFSSEKEVFFISAEDVCTFTEPELVRMSPPNSPG